MIAHLAKVVEEDPYPEWLDKFMLVSLDLNTNHILDKHLELIDLVPIINKYGQQVKWFHLWPSDNQPDDTPGNA